MTRQQIVMRNNYKRFIDKNKEIIESEERHSEGKAIIGSVLLVGLIIVMMVISNI